jgi:hypothetical protein
MGLLDRWRETRIKHPVSGQFTIAAVKLYSRSPGYYRSYDVDGVVSAPGITAVPVHRSGVLVRDWEPLAVGQVFSATVDATDAKRCIIDFPTTKPTPTASRADRAAAAEQLAAETNAENGGTPASD